MNNKILVILSITICLYGSDDLEYDRLFFYLEENNIILGKDISAEELFEIIHSSNKIKKNEQNNLFEKINSLIYYKKSQYDKIRTDIDNNPDGKINKTIQTYLDDNNEFVDEAQKDIKEKDDDSWFSKSINYILELMKY